MTHPVKRFSLLIAMAMLLCAPPALAQDSAKKEKAAPAAPAMGVEAIDDFIAKQKVDKSNSDWKFRLAKPPKVRFDPKKQYFWHIQTNVGRSEEHTSELQSP